MSDTNKEIEDAILGMPRRKAVERVRELLTPKDDITPEEWEIIRLAFFNAKQNYLVTIRRGTLDEQKRKEEKFAEMRTVYSKICKKVTRR